MQRRRTSSVRRARATRAALVRRALLSAAVLVALAFTLHSLHLSNASITAGSGEPVSVFTAGELSHTNSRSGQVMVTASGMNPGDSSSGTMTLTAAGDGSADYLLSVESLSDVPASPALSDTLELTVEDITGTATTLYDDDVADLESVDLGIMTPGNVRSYRVTLTYPDGPNDASLQGATMTLALRITGISQ